MVLWKKKQMCPRMRLQFDLNKSITAHLVKHFSFHKSIKGTTNSTILLMLQFPINQTWLLK